MTRVFIALVLLNTSCAYHFGHFKRNIPGNYDKVAVPMFKNQSPEVGVETYFTRSLIEEIERAHIASVVDKEDAQIVLEGTILELGYAGGTQVTQDTIPTLPLDTVLNKDYRVYMKVRIQARRRSDQKIVWLGDFIGERSYPAAQVTKPIFNTVNPLYNHSSRHQNIDAASKDMMAEAYSKMTENF